MAEPRFDFAVIGGGILGMASALELSRATEASIVVLEAEKTLAFHQTGHNSGVIHSGLYYKPGSLKATNCFEGRRRLLELCNQEGVHYELCGKLVIATHEDEIPRLDELERRGRANGIEGLERLGPDGIRVHEPHAVGIDALWVPGTGIIDYVEVTRTYARLFNDNGGEVRVANRVLEVQRTAAGLRLTTDREALLCGHLVSCGGLQCDRLARLCGIDPGIRIVPFRGEYFNVVAERRHLVRGLIYPVPDPQFPFLGVHLTRGVDGEVEAGPNAVLALRREDYGRRGFSIADTVSTIDFPGFWKMAWRHWRVGLQEVRRSGSRRLFARSLQRFVPEIRAEDLGRPGAGVRAQALDADGKLLDDFHIVEAEGMIHVLNAPSPGATASLSIGRKIARSTLDQLGIT